MTLKTPLPSKIGQNEFINERTTRIELVNTLDQLIDHVKELSERVEGEDIKFELGHYYKSCLQFGVEPTFKNFLEEYLDVNNPY